MNAPVAACLMRAPETVGSGGAPLPEDPEGAAGVDDVPVVGAEDVPVDIFFGMCSVAEELSATVHVAKTR
jgi:hypothetical protein